MVARVETGIDGAWLARLGEADPIRHVWAVWDRLMFPERIEFRTLYEDGAPTAYLLLWHGSPKVTVVHWVGSARDPRPLLDALPPRPLVANVPEELAEEVQRRCAPARSGIVHLMAFEPGRTVPPVPPNRARRLVPADLPALTGLAERHPDPLTSPYLQVDLTRDTVFGAFDWGRLGAVARAQVALPGTWVIGGVFTVPDLRGRHLGTDVTQTAVRAAREAGARPTLYVRDDNAPARRIYDQLGFQPFDRRALIEATEPA
jgi:ribosomal protein S18 acetylase RimI-like enzyme